MRPMSMWFVLKDPARADGLKVGDKVRFVAERVGTQYTITQIEPAR
jgi:Cu/Ag efflux protein CusF